MRAKFVLCIISCKRRYLLYPNSLAHTCLHPLRKVPTFFSKSLAYLLPSSSYIFLARSRFWLRHLYNKGDEMKVFHRSTSDAKTDITLLLFQPAKDLFQMIIVIAAVTAHQVSLFSTILFLCVLAFTHATFKIANRKRYKICTT